MKLLLPLVDVKASLIAHGVCISRFPALQPHSSALSCGTDSWRTRPCISLPMHVHPPNHPNSAVKKETRENSPSLLDFTRLHHPLASLCLNRVAYFCQLTHSLPLSGSCRILSPPLLPCLLHSARQSQLCADSLTITSPWAGSRPRTRALQPTAPRYHALDPHTLAPPQPAQVPTTSAAHEMAS
jgi:hypothetical protein